MMRQRILLLPLTLFTVLLIATDCSSTSATAFSRQLVKVIRRPSPSASVDDAAAAEAALSTRHNSRIFGGINATEGSAPHQIALFKNGQFLCGGSLISLKTVLCAAHCVFEDENSPSKFLVRYGSLLLSNGTDVKVASISRHPQYSPLLTDYDVAILHLAANITPGPNANLIELASETPPSGSLVTISGFGLVDLNEPLAPSEHLQLADQMVVMDHDQCEADWTSPAITITDRILCVISDNQTALPGDSGGPMVFGGKLVGITSFIIIDLTDFTILDGYMNVVTVRGWIEATMKSDGEGGNLRQSALLAVVLLLVGRFGRWWLW